ncbi:heme-binding protein [Endozoicomonas sp. OPT23]|uniref:GlcG/HbpS family heme-binding protein n=1 Tax=Endozoicomonas sp. OPT23 TaxID=2072845 RepID=UPI00129AE13D|nr:heme-binding protein [Endozoicomonas sp. OPT23]MRI34497.1 heme-binding protein [Endozoicomonas sp. OPT23]
MKKITALCGSLVLSVLAASAAQAEETRPYLTSANALKGIQACQTLAASKGWNMAMVIVDRGDDVVASFRMDEALPAAYTGATLKAGSSLSWGMPSGDIANITNKKPEFKAFPGLLTVGGGEPLFSKSGKLMGAIGVAGGYVEHDQECAKAAVAAMK